MMDPDESLDTGYLISHSMSILKCPLKADAGWVQVLLKLPASVWRRCLPAKLADM